MDCLAEAFFSPDSVKRRPRPCPPVQQTIYCHPLFLLYALWRKGCSPIVDMPRSLDELETKAVTPETKVYIASYSFKNNNNSEWNAIAIRWHFFRLEMYSFVKFTLPLSTEQRSGHVAERKKIEIPRNRNVWIVSLAFVTCHFQYIRPVAYWKGPFTCRLLPALFTIPCELCRSYI